jgi:hypothetical protein
MPGAYNPVPPRIAGRELAPWPAPERQSCNVGVIRAVEFPAMMAAVVRST